MEVAQLAAAERIRRNAHPLEAVHAGEEIVIAKNGKPFARLAPLAPQSPRQPGLLKGDLQDDLFAPVPEGELAAWES